MSRRACAADRATRVERHAADTGGQAGLSASVCLMNREAAAVLTRGSARKICDSTLMLLSALHYFGCHWLRQCVASVVEIVQRNRCGQARFAVGAMSRLGVIHR